MTFDEYQKAAMRTANSLTTFEAKLGCMGLGVAGEAGEVADLAKKQLYHGHDLNPAKMRKELGDVLWYLALGAELLGTPLEEIAKENVEKLLRRYPTGFSAAASMRRSADDQ